MRRITSSLNAINSLIGGYESGLLTAFFGPPMSGKSTLLCQEAFYFSQFFGSLFIDTEGGLINLLNAWKNVFEKRFNTQADIVEIISAAENEKIRYKFNPENFNNTPIFIINLRAVKKLLEFFGVLCDIEVSKTGKYSFRYKGVCSSLCKELLENFNVKMIVIDSLTNPINVFSGGLVNYPARADAEKLLFKEFQNICDEYSPYFIITHHMTRDPQNPYSVPDIPGGKVIRHNTKISLYLEIPKSRRYRDYRRLWLDRYFDKPRLSEKRIIVITNRGFFDADKISDVEDEEESEIEL